jgi:hypothetical protein
MPRPRPARRPTSWLDSSFVIDGTVETPLSCPSDDWEFPTPAQEAGSPRCVPIVGSASIVCQPDAAAVDPTGAICCALSNGCATTGACFAGSRHLTVAPWLVTLQAILSS